ncbi:MAG: tetratricopeptide repeat protein [Flavobacteriaceae bacterium]|nr:tetratricopeptide repeat protein [Flavobacteriaceae bacterium]
MKKNLILLLFLSAQLFSQNSEQLFKEGNEHYKLSNYSEAISSYEKIEALGLISSALYYNLGNCHYKLNQVASAIYNYEKALLLDPLNEDAQSNLVFAKRLTIDAIEEIPKTIFQKLDDAIVKKLSYNEWAIVNVVFSVLGTLLFLLFYFSFTPSKKRVFFVTSILSFLLLLVTLFFTIKEYTYSNTTVEAIIFSKETSVNNAPTDNSEKIFTLHEGTKVLVLDTVDNWKKIRISDGKTGWIISDKIKILSIFEKN